MNYKANLPLNISSEHEWLFSDRLEYAIEAPRLKEVKNAFVSHWGIGIKNGGLIKGTVPNSFGKGSPRFRYPFWRKGIEQWMVSKYGKSLPSIKLSGPQQYILIHSPWFGYFSWVTECIPRLLQTKAYHKKAKLIYPEGWQKFEFVNQALALFPELEHEVIPADHHMFVENLVLPMIKPWTFKFRPKELHKTKEFVINAIDQKEIKLELGDKIYLSRAKAARRKFANETEVEEAVKKYGFSVVHFEDYSFYEQVHLMSKAKYFISIHGAGMANILWMKENAGFLEMIKTVSDKSKQIYSFWRLANALEIDYFIQYCMPEAGNDSNFTANLLADTNALEQNIQLMLKD